MRKLLIADDEDGVRSLVRMTLEADAYEILEARDGDEALAVARDQRPELVFLDVMMPGASGDDYLTKPFSPVKLLSKVEQVFGALDVS
jgi:DNA-binding response OmpR family regulator